MDDAGAVPMDHDARVAADEEFLGLREAGSGRFTFEVRTAEIRRHPDPGPGRVCPWLRRSDGGPVTPALAGYLADLVPLSIVRGCGVTGAGTSLDNTIRIGAAAETEWILLDLRPNLAVGSYGHGIANVWTEDGHLLAVASQTASLMELDFDPLTAFGSHASELQERNR
jgi:hypothetical protein